MSSNNKKKGSSARTRVGSESCDSDSNDVSLTSNEKSHRLNIRVSPEKGLGPDNPMVSPEKGVNRRDVNAQDTSPDDFSGFEKEDLERAQERSNVNGSQSRRNKRSKRAEDMDSVKAMLTQLMGEVTAMKNSRPSATVSQELVDEVPCGQGPPTKVRKDYRLMSDQNVSLDEESVFSLGLNRCHDDLNQSYATVGSNGHGNSRKDDSLDISFDKSVEKTEKRDLITLGKVRECIYKTLDRDICPLPKEVQSGDMRGVSACLDADDVTFKSLPCSNFVRSSITEVNKYFCGVGKEDQYVEYDGPLKSYNIGHEMDGDKFITFKKPPIKLFNRKVYEIHEAPMPLFEIAHVESGAYSGKEKPMAMVAQKTLESIEKDGRASMAVASQLDFLLGTLAKMMDSPIEDLSKDMVVRILQSMGTSIAHMSQLSTRHVANLMLIRRDAYIKNMGMKGSKIGKIMRLQPINGKQLFNGKVDEALELKEKHQTRELINSAVTTNRYSGGRKYDSSRHSTANKTGGRSFPMKRKASFSQNDGQKPKAKKPYSNVGEGKFPNNSSKNSNFRPKY